MGVWSEHKFNQNLRSGSNTHGDDATVLFSVIEQVHAKLHTGWVVPWHPGALPSITNWKAFGANEMHSTCWLFTRSGSKSLRLSLTYGELYNVMG